MLRGVADRAVHLQTVARCEVRGVRRPPWRRRPRRGVAVERRAEEQRPGEVERDAYVGQLVLDRLVRTDRAAELAALLDVRDRVRQQALAGTEQLGAVASTARSKAASRSPIATPAPRASTAKSRRAGSTDSVSVADLGVGGAPSTTIVASLATSASSGERAAAARTAPAARGSVRESTSRAHQRGAGRRPTRPTGRARRDCPSASRATTRSTGVAPARPAPPAPAAATPISASRPQIFSPGPWSPAGPGPDGGGGVRGGEQVVEGTRETALLVGRARTSSAHLPRETEDALGDDVALDLVGAGVDRPGE